MQVVVVARLEGYKVTSLSPGLGALANTISTCFLFAQILSSLS